MAIRMSSYDQQVNILEQINALIDLYIDYGCYEEINNIIRRDALDPGKAVKSVKNNVGKIDHKEILEKLQLGPQQGEKKEEFVSNFSMGNSDYPVRYIWIPEDFRKKFPKSKVPLDVVKLRPWSHLFWAKLIRAELLLQNRDPWLKLYDHVILHLEGNIPSCFPEDPLDKKKEFWWKTLLNYFMELSAVSSGEASLGYAERARILCDENYKKKKRDELFDSYNRWIWYNKAIAYQHTLRPQEAISHFGEVTAKFFKHHPDSDSQQDLITDIEFLLNIAPAIMQGAEINLQGQLAYHALKSLNDLQLDKWLKSIEKRQYVNLLSKVVNRVQSRRELLRLEALLRLGDLDYSEEIIKIMHPKIDADETGNITHKYNQLPRFNQSRSRSIFQVKFIEQKVMWYREEAIRLLNYISNNKGCDADSHEETEVNPRLKKLSSQMNMLRNRYWLWVKDNPQDRKVYFSNWAQFLGTGMKIISLLDDNCGLKIKGYDNFLKSIVMLYEKHKRSLPDSSGKRKGTGIALQDLRSDDPFDIRGGLGEFYDEMISTKFSNKALNAKSLIENWCGINYYDKLQSEHAQFLDALAKWDQDFGEHQRIEALKRCNERIKWFAIDKKDCISCLAAKQCILPSLLTEDKQDQENNETNLLFKADYEIIMSEAEGHFTKHLKDNSSHIPARPSLHFMGLQRWNSLTPAQGKSIGGGYFVYHTDHRGEVDLGIAIDPGFDFIRNLFRQGFSIRDIDIVLISHAHPDHLWDFESIVQLLHGLSQKKNVEQDNHHRINVILTAAAYQRYEHYVIRNYNLRQFIEPFVIDVHGEQEHRSAEHFEFIENVNNKTESERPPHRWKPILPLPKRDKNNDKSSYRNCEIKKLVITPTFAYHDDYSQISDSYGFLLKFKFDENSKDICFGYTGDTKWVGTDLYIDGCPAKSSSCQALGHDECPENIVHQYRDCDVLLLHLGSLIDHKHKKRGEFSYYKSPKECDLLIREKNHLYLMGMIRFLNALGKYAGWSCQKDKLLLISEFGEELQGGIRIDLVRRLREMIAAHWQILPVDVGLDVLLNKTYKFICTICNKEKPLSQIQYERYGYDEAIFYFCHTCVKARPWDVRQDRMRQLYEIGKELEVLPPEQERHKTERKNHASHN